MKKVKEFYQKHKTEIIVAGVIIGGVIIVCKLKPRIKEVEFLPEWARKWMAKCNTEGLLYENGLPIFADENQTTVYSDALDPSYGIEQAKKDGFKVIEREI